MTTTQPDPYASAAQSAETIKPDMRSAAEKQLDAAMDAAWANEQGNDRTEYFGILRRVAIDVIDRQSARIAELEAQLAAPRGTDAQILKERQLTAFAIEGAMALGYQNAEPPPDDSAWLRPFYEMGRHDAERDAQLDAVGAGGVSALMPASQWVPVSEGLPKSGNAVLLDIGKKVPLRAIWVPKFFLEAGYEAPEGFGEYDEATDEYYCPEGWYEWNQNEEVHWAVSETPAHWMPLPPSPATTKEKP